MNTLKKQDIQQLEQIIDSVKAASNHDIVLIADNEKQANMFKELLPGYKIICTYGHLENDDKVQILPIDEIKPIKICYE